MTVFYDFPLSLSLCLVVTTGILLLNQLHPFPRSNDATRLPLEGGVWVDRTVQMHL